MAAASHTPTPGSSSLAAEGSPSRLIAPGLLLGLGLGGFFDGILLHASTYLLTAAGLPLLARVAARGVAWSNRMLLGLLLAGWGTFNLVEGTIDHHILGIHHVKADAPILDLAFLALGAGLLAGGLVLARRGEREAEARSIDRMKGAL